MKKTNLILKFISVKFISIKEEKQTDELINEDLDAHISHQFRKQRLLRLR